MTTNSYPVGVQKTLDVLNEQLPALPKLHKDSVYSIKGFDANLSCRSFKFEVGAHYHQEGWIACCQNGFHAIPHTSHPLTVFGFYEPAKNRFAVVEQMGKKHREGDNIASACISIHAEINLGQLAMTAVKWVFEQANWLTGSSVEGAGKGCSSNGSTSAASSNGYASAASSNGYASAASSNGSTSAASSNGYASAASSNGGFSTAISSGQDGRVKGKNGDALFLVYRSSYDGEILYAWHGIVGKGDVQEDVWYTLGDKGQPRVNEE